jgi:hypothetical protein
MLYEWLCTESPKLAYTQAPSAVSGWKLHAVPMPAGKDHSLRAIGRRTAACGLQPAHGWAVDLFIEDHCKRCERALQKDRCVAHEG